MLPDGRFNVDAFLCLFDVSTVADRQIEKQVEYTSLILNSLVKTKKPVILVTTKNDEAQEAHVREAEKLLQRKEFRGCNIPLIESSSHFNVNVELAFLTLAHLVDRASAKGKLKMVPYSEAARMQKERRDVATDAYLNLMRSLVTDYKDLWIPVNRKLQQNENYIYFRDLCGTEQARQLFRKHIRNLREDFVRRKKEMYLEKLKYALLDILPDLTTVAER